MKKTIKSLIGIMLVLAIMVSTFAVVTAGAANALLAPEITGIRVANGSSVQMEWFDENETVSGYYVYRSTTGKSGSWTRIANVKNPEYTDASSLPNKTYFYTVKAYVKVDGKVIASASGAKEKIKTTWAKPVFTLAGNSGTGVLLKWDTAGIDGVAIYRSLTGQAGSWTKIKVIKGTKTNSYTDTNVKIGETYYYCFKVYKTIDGKDYYSPSSKAYKKVISDVAIPQDLDVRSKSEGMEISFNKVSGTKGYIIYRSLTGKKGTWTKIKTTTSNNTISYLDKKVEAGKVYYYTVKSYKILEGKTISSSSAPAVHATCRKGSVAINTSVNEVIFSELLEKQTIKIIVDGPTSYRDRLEVEVEDEGIVACRMGDRWNGNETDLTVTRIGYGETKIRIFYKNIPGSETVINVSAAKLELDDDYIEAKDLLKEAYDIFSEVLSLLAEAQGDDVSDVEKAKLVEEALDKVAEVSVILEKAKVLAEKYAEYDNGNDKTIISGLLVIVKTLRDSTTPDSINSPAVQVAIAGIKGVLEKAGII